MPEDQLETVDDTPQPEPEPPQTEEPAPGSSQQTGPTEQYVSLLEQQLREQNRQIQELINKSTVPEHVEPQRDPEAEKARFYTDPMESTRSVVREELKATVAPLLDFVKEFKSGSAYTDLKNKYRVMPQFATAMADPQIEAAVDQIMAKAEKNDANMTSAIVHAVGLKAMGQLPGSPPVTTPAPQPQPQPQHGGTAMPQPPHLRPSGSQQPLAGNTTKRRTLNELEKRMARERWPSDPDAENKYLNWLELPADQVVIAGQDGKLPQPGAKK